MKRTSWTRSHETRTAATGLPFHVPLGMKARSGPKNVYENSKCFITSTELLNFDFILKVK